MCNRFGASWRFTGSAAKDQEFGQPHRPACSRFHLSLHGSLILLKDVSPKPFVQLNFDFTILKVVACDRATLQLRD